jgi:hypothetical protein
MKTVFYPLCNMIFISCGSFKLSHSFSLPRNIISSTKHAFIGEQI